MFLKCSRCGSIKWSIEEIDYKINKVVLKCGKCPNVVNLGRVNKTKKEILIC